MDILFERSMNNQNTKFYGARSEVEEDGKCFLDLWWLLSKYNRFHYFSLSWQKVCSNMKEGKSCGQQRMEALPWNDLILHNLKANSKIS